MNIPFQLELLAFGAIMKETLLSFAFFTIALGSALAQDSSKPGNSVKLTPEQQNLAAFVGNWELSVEGETKKGHATIKSILGGRFITEDVKITVGEISMEWHGVLGYNKGKKQYTGIWFDNANNITKSESGKSNSSGRSISFRGTHAGKRKFIWNIANDGQKKMTIKMYQLTSSGEKNLVLNISGKKHNPSSNEYRN